MTEITPDQARALAVLVAALRPTWDPPGILAALRDARRKGTATQLAHAAINAATEPTNRTPAVIALDGPHWTQARPVETLPANYERCPHPGHRSYPAWACGACRADALAADEQQAQAPERPDTPRATPPVAGPDLVRAAMATHGIPTADQVRARQAATTQEDT